VYLQHMSEIYNFKEESVKADIYEMYLKLGPRPILDKYKIDRKKLSIILRGIDPDYTTKKKTTRKCHLFQSETHAECSKCHSVKEYNQFYKQKNSKNGHSPACKECNNKRVLIWQNNNKEKIRISKRLWRENNPERANALYEKHKEKGMAADKAKYHNDPVYRQKRINAKREYRNDPNNKEKIRISKKKSVKKARENNPILKVIANLRTRLTFILNGQRRAECSKKLIGCDTETLKAHLESLFKPGMNWQNYGRWYRGQPMKWHIDHIIPCEFFDMSNSEEQKKCYHYTNMQPMWAIDNILKGVSIQTEPYIPKFDPTKD